MCIVEHLLLWLRYKFADWWEGSFDMYSHSTSGYMLLQIAVQGNNISTIERLLEVGLDPNTLNVDER